LFLRLASPPVEPTLEVVIPPFLLIHPRSPCTSEFLLFAYFKMRYSLVTTAILVGLAVAAPLPQNNCGNRGDGNSIIAELQATFDRDNPNGTPANGSPDDLNGDGVINVFEAGAQASKKRQAGRACGNSQGSANGNANAKNNNPNTSGNANANDNANGNANDDTDDAADVNDNANGNTNAKGDANANANNANNNANNADNADNAADVDDNANGDATGEDAMGGNIVQQLQSTFDRNNPNGTPTAPGNPDDLNGDGVINVFEAGAQASKR
ncbi:hypothetical protein BKA63DRAFT_593581, partial [Paraphoma chrysanthemicola]